MTDGSVTVEVPADDEHIETPAKKTPDTQQETQRTERPRKPVATEAADDLKDQLKSMTRRAENAESATEEAQRRAQAAVAERDEAKKTAARFKDEADKGNYESIVNAMTAMKTTREAAEEEYTQAMERGDFRAAAKAQSRLSEASARYVELEGGKTALEAKLKGGEREVETPQTRGAPTFEDHLKTFTPTTAAWFRKNPQFLTDPVKNAEAQRAHFAALGDGVKPDTPEYFQFVEKRLKVGDHAEDVEQDLPSRGQDERTTQRRERPVPAAAPSRDGNNGARRSGSSRTVTLTSEQQEAARISGLTNEEYAREVIKLEDSRG